METMNRVYYDISHPSSYSSIKKLSTSGKRSVQETALWLKSQDAYTLHKPVRKRFQRNPYMMSYIDYEWQIDLMDLRQFGRENDSHKYVLVVIDIFSKYIWLYALKSKSGKEICHSLRGVFDNSHRKPRLLFSDKGKEFLNHDVMSLLKERGIIHFTCNNPDVKCSIVERVIRTIKEKLWRYFTRMQTRRYINVLGQLANSYNNSVHSTIGMAPSQVTKLNSFEVWLKLYKRAKSIVCKDAKYKEGDYVRISKEKGNFEKSYEYSWSLEIFKIKRVLKKCQPVYELIDLTGEAIKGTFYESELQVVNPGGVFLIDKVLKRRGKGTKRQLLVSWKGYPSKFNSWISATNLISLKEQSL